MVGLRKQCRRPTNGAAGADAATNERDRHKQPWFCPDLVGLPSNLWVQIASSPHRVCLCEDRVPVRPRR